MRGRRGAAFGALVVVVALALVAAWPPVTARLKAVALVAEAVGVAVPRPLAPAVSRTEAHVGGVRGDLYTADRPAPAIVLLPGATPAGGDDTRVVAVATALARSARTVFVPELALYDRRVDDRDLDRITDAALALPAHPRGQGPVVLVGFSYGGSYGLVAAADPRLAGELALVATFGAYWDLRGVLQAATTGTSIVEGVTDEWEPDPRAEELLAEHAVQLAPAGSRDELTAALDGEADPAALDPASRALYALLDNDDPRATFPLAEQLGPEARATLARFSPAHVAGDIAAPLVALHARDDPAVPHAELRRLQAARPDARVATVEAFSHVDFTPEDLGAAIPDLWRTWRFAGWVLAAQERMPAARSAHSQPRRDQEHESHRLSRAPKSSLALGSRARAERIR